MADPVTKKKKQPFSFGATAQPQTLPFSGMPGLAPAPGLAPIPSAAPPVNPLTALLGAQPTAPAIDWTAIQNIAHPPVRHLGMGGQEITADNPMGHGGGNPFTNGFFGASPGTPEFSGRTAAPQFSGQPQTAAAPPAVDPTLLLKLLGFM